MKKIAGILLLAALVLTLTACRNDNPQEEYEPSEEYVESTLPDHYGELDYAPIDDSLTRFAPSPELGVETSVFSELASSEREEEITHIVLHFISNVLANRTEPYIMEDIHRIFLDYGVSAHYIIDRDGTIHLAVPEYRVAFHAGAGTLTDFPEYENRLNQYSIGIELLGIGSQADMSIFLTADEYEALDPRLIGFTDAQYYALNRLLNDILARHPAIQPNRTHIIGHDEYSPSNTDPGELFEWERLDFVNTPRI